MRRWFCYTNYAGYRLRLFGPGDVPVMVWKNAGALLSGIGGLFIFNLGDTYGGTHLARLLAFASIAGTLRLARRNGMSPYHWFAAGYVALLLVWHFPPAERFLIPLAPLLVAGLYTELRHLAGLLRVSFAASAANRAIAVLLACALAAVALWTPQTTYTALRHDLPEILAQHRSLAAAHQGAFRWARENMPLRSMSERNFPERANRGLIERVVDDFAMQSILVHEVVRQADNLPLRLDLFQTSQ